MWYETPYANSGSAVASSSSFWEISLGSVLVIALIFFVEFGRPYIRRKIRLKRAFLCNFAVDDANGQQHLVNNLVLPVDSCKEVALRIRPKINFTQTDLLVNFGSQMEGKPEIVGYFNAFVAWGRGRDETPETDHRHYVDRKGAYHTTMERKRTTPNVFTMGYKIHTNSEGCFPLRIAAITDDGEAWPDNNCYIIVEKALITRMKCVKHDDCCLDPEEVHSIR